jgi:hypothetical protein
MIFSIFVNAFKDRKIDIFVRPIMPTYKGNNSAAVAVLYSGDEGTPAKVSFTPEKLGLTHASGYIVSEVFSGEKIGT